MTTATLETDTVGTWVGSSYLWASVGDWARMGEMMMNDGQWKGTQVIPAGWLKLAGTSALPEGEGAGLRRADLDPRQPGRRGMQGLSRASPQDTVSMEGHWGQIVAMVPSRNAVIVRLGWTFNGREAFDGCKFVSDVLGRCRSSALSVGSATVDSTVTPMDITPEQATQFAHTTIPAIGRLGVRVEELGPGSVELVVPIEGNGNHFGTMYAGALFSLVEMPGGFLPLSVLGAQFTPIVTRVDIRFIAAARTDVRLTAQIGPGRAAASGGAGHRGGQGRLHP